MIMHDSDLQMDHCMWAAWRSRIHKHNAWECFTCVVLNGHLIHRQVSCEQMKSNLMISISCFAHSGKPPMSSNAPDLEVLCPSFLRSRAGRSHTNKEWDRPTFSAMDAIGDPWRMILFSTHGGAAWLNFHQRWKSSQRNPSISPAGRKHFSLATGCKNQKNHRKTMYWNTPETVPLKHFDAHSPSARLQILGPHHLHARWGWVWQRPFSRFIRGRSWLLNAADSQALALHYSVLSACS